MARLGVSTSENGIEERGLGNIELYDLPLTLPSPRPSQAKDGERGSQPKRLSLPSQIGRAHV